MPAHSTLTGADLHEPKGAATASVHQVYAADGAGSGAWTATPTFSNYTATASIFNLNKIYLSLYYPDIGTAGPASQWIAMPRAGTITNLWLNLDAADTTTDTTVTASIGGVNVTNGVITAPHAGSAAGNVVTATPTAANTVSAGQALKFTSSQGSSIVTPCTITIELTASA